MLLMLSSWLSKLRIESSRYTESSHLIKLIPHLTQKLDHYFEYTRENEYIKASAYLNPDTRNISSDIEKNSERWVVSDEEGRKCVLRCIDKMGVRREQVDDDGGAEPEKIDQEETLGSDFASHVLRAMCGDKVDASTDGMDEDRLERHLKPTSKERGIPVVGRLCCRTTQADQKAPLRGTVNFGQAVMILKRYTSYLRKLRGFFLDCNRINKVTISELHPCGLDSTLSRSNRARMGATRLRGYMLCKSLPVDEDGKLVTTVK